MPQDFLGNDVSKMDDSVLQAVNDFALGLLAYETRAERVVPAADAAPECCLANVYAGFLWMFLEAPDAATRASRYVDAALRAAPRATRREQLNAAVLGAWARDDVAGASRICEIVESEFPRDLIVLKLHQYFEFNRGNSPAMLRIALRALPHNAHVAYMHGMTAFAYEQCHLLDEAHQAARQALALERREPWAQHALAHVMLTRGEIDAGAVLLEGMSETWVGLNSFMSTHLWWHLGLFHLSQGRMTEVLANYDRHCWGLVNTYSQDQVGAVSLLARMELAGIDVGGRWQQVAEYLVARVRDTVQPFLTLQYAYGLARAGRTEAGALLDAVRDAAAGASPEMRDTWRDVALPACEGLICHARGEFDAAWRHLGRAMPRLSEVGGSHAQRDLFDQLLIDAAFKSGRLAVAQQMLELRRRTDPCGVPVNRMLGDVYEGLSLPQLAAEARERAAATSRRHATAVAARASRGSA